MLSNIEMDNPSRPANILFRAEKVNKFFGEKQVLNQVSFSIQQDEVLSLLGPSGCGKSTLIRCLNGLEPIKSGRLFFDGKEIERTEKSWQRIRPEIGMAFQSYDLFPNKSTKTRPQTSYRKSFSAADESRFGRLR